MTWWTTTRHISEEAYTDGGQRVGKWQNTVFLHYDLLLLNQQLLFKRRNNITQNQI